MRVTYSMGAPSEHPETPEAVLILAETNLERLCDAVVRPEHFTDCLIPADLLETEVGQDGIHPAKLREQGLEDSLIAWTRIRGDSEGT